MIKEELIAFEEEIATLFNKKEILAPIHLYSNNEDEMIKIFEDVRPDDWVLCTWRSHYQCLLKGVPRDQVRQAILDGKSISLCFPEYRVFSSAIVTGILPIAVGIALSIKKCGGINKVHCFVGDMTSETGSMAECVKYSYNHDLPIRFIVEDNGKSVCTDTRKTWGIKEDSDLFFCGVNEEKLYYYKYSNKWPHAGSGSRIQF